jgi:hypothetical protein
VDLFSAGNNRLALGYEYTMEYLNGGHPYCYGTISPRARTLGSPLEMVYQHYRSKELELPNIRIAAEKMRERFPLDVGIHLAGSRDITISGCLIEANSAAGIYAECLYDGCEQVMVSGNRIQYNDGYGLESYAGTNIKSSGNQYTGNGKSPKQEKISKERILLMAKD